jgi:hypothetical protein
LSEIFNDLILAQSMPPGAVHTNSSLCASDPNRPPVSAAPRTITVALPDDIAPAQFDHEFDEAGRAVRERPRHRADHSTPGFSLCSIGSNPEIRRLFIDPTEMETRHVKR